MKVGIVGLGAAGLRSAMLLERAGVEVQLFEAKGRPGGRLHTVDEGHGAIYEAGGEWIDADHHRILALLKEFGLEPEGRQTWPAKVVFDEHQTTEDLLWSDALEDDLRVEGAAKELCRNLVEPPWRNTDAKEIDNRILGDFLAEHTHSERGLWWVSAKYRSDEGDDPNEIGLLGWLAGYLHYLERDGEVMSAFRVPGGWRSLCESMLNGLKATPSFGSILRRVSQDGAKVKLTFEDGDAVVDRVLLTLPPPCLERVIFEPPLSVAKRCAVEGCRMSRSIKICWEFKSAWWKDEGWGGSMLCDGPLQQTWDGSMGSAPILTSYICGDEAVEWIKLGDPIRAGVYELSRICPQASKQFVRGWVHDWVSDPYSQGSFSHLAPGYVLDHMEHIRTPEGLVHFAGEHTATWTGFIEGALESAERASQEIVDA